MHPRLIEAGKIAEDFLKGPGIIRGTRAIAEYLGVSPSTVSRWRRRFKGRTEVALCFPAMEMPTGHGWNVEVWTHVGLIVEWMHRWSIIDGEALRERTPRTRHSKAVTIGESVERADGHLAERAGRSLHQRLASLSEPEREWVIRNELSNAELDELGLTPRSVQVAPKGQAVCTCGQSGAPCTAH